MDRRSYAVGIGVGQFMKERNLSKRDIQNWFARQNEKDACNESCPFLEECNIILSLTSEEKTLCSIMGVEEE